MESRTDSVFAPGRAVNFWNSVSGAPETGTRAGSDAAPGGDCPVSIPCGPGVGYVTCPGGGHSPRGCVGAGGEPAATMIVAVELHSTGCKR